MRVGASDLLLVPLGQPDPLAPNFTLVTSRLSGVVTMAQAFWIKLSNCYWEERVALCNLHTSRHREVGVIGVVRGKQIARFLL